MGSHIYFLIQHQPEILQQLMSLDADLIALLQTMNDTQLSVFAYILPIGYFPELALANIVAGIKALSANHIAPIMEILNQYMPDERQEKLQWQFHLMKPALCFRKPEEVPQLISHIRFHNFQNF